MGERLDRFLSQLFDFGNATLRVCDRLNLKESANFVIGIVFGIVVVSFGLVFVPIGLKENIVTWSGIVLIALSAGGQGIFLVRYGFTKPIGLASDTSITSLSRPW